MWWKIYYWFFVISVVISSIIAISDLFAGVVHSLYSYFLLISGSVAIYGLYCYLHAKKSFSFKFWRYFFWINLVLGVASLIYDIAPQTPFIDTFYYSKINSADDGLLMYELLLLLLDIPIYYALYQISKGKYRTTVKKKIVGTN